MNNDDEMMEDLIDVYVDNVRVTNTIILLFLQCMERNDAVLRGLISSSRDTQFRSRARQQRARNTRESRNNLESRISQYFSTPIRLSAAMSSSRR